MYPVSQRPLRKTTKIIVFSQKKTSFMNGFSTPRVLGLKVWTSGEASDGFIAAKFGALTSYLHRRWLNHRIETYATVKLDHFPGRGVKKKKNLKPPPREGNMVGVRKSLSTLLPKKKKLTVYNNTKTQSDTVLQESFLFNIFKSKKSHLYQTTMKSDRESLATIPPTHRKQKQTANNLCSHPKFFNSHFSAWFGCCAITR